MRRLVALLAGFLVLFATLVPAQNGADARGIDRTVFAPFVSRLRVAVRDPQVRLTWRDSEDLSGGTYRVYRHDEEITQDTIDDATLVGEVLPGVETFLDTPLEEGSYYYAVLASEPDGRLYPIFVPFRNKTLRPVAVTQLESEEDLAAQVYDIQAQPQDTAIVVVFDPSRSGRTLAIYRSTTPFSDAASIGSATLLEEIPSSNRRYADYPVPGVDYFYGVFDKVLIERGTVEIQDGENVLSTPVRIALADQGPEVTIEFPQSTKRPAPLPILQLATGIQSGERLALPDIPGGGAQPVRAETRTAVDRFLARAPAPEPFAPEPRILPEERSAAGEGVAVTLSRIVTDEFAGGAYREAADLLETLLDLPVGDATERRIRFYRGQALYFDGRIEPAFMEFLLAAEGDLYPEVRPWMDGILTGRRVDS